MCSLSPPWRRGGRPVTLSVTHDVLVCGASPRLTTSTDFGIAPVTSTYDIVVAGARRAAGVIRTAGAGAVCRGRRCPGPASSSRAPRSSCPSRSFVRRARHVDARGRRLLADEDEVVRLDAVEHAGRCRRWRRSCCRGSGCLGGTADVGALDADEVRPELAARDGVRRDAVTDVAGRRGVGRVGRVLGPGQERADAALEGLGEVAGSDADVLRDEERAGVVGGHGVGAVRVRDLVGGVRPAGRR